MNGLGGTDTAPVVIGARGCSDALICMLRIGVLRAFGAGFGIGTVCAETAVTAVIMAAAISAAMPARRLLPMPRLANCAVIRNFGFPFNMLSRAAPALLSWISAKRGIVFP